MIPALESNLTRLLAAARTLDFTAWFDTLPQRDRHLIVVHTRWPHRRTDALHRLAEILLAMLQAESTLHRKVAIHPPRSAKKQMVFCVLHDVQCTPQGATDVLLPFMPRSGSRNKLCMRGLTGNIHRWPPFMNVNILLNMYGRAVPQLPTAHPVDHHARSTYVAPQLTPLGRWTAVTLLQSVPINPGQLFTPTPRNHQ